MWIFAGVHIFDLSTHKKLKSTTQHQVSVIARLNVLSLWLYPTQTQTQTQTHNEVNFSFHNVCFSPKTHIVFSLLTNQYFNHLLKFIYSLSFVMFIMNAIYDTRSCTTTSSFAWLMCVASIKGTKKLLAYYFVIHNSYKRSKTKSSQWKYLKTFSWFSTNHPLRCWASSSSSFSVFDWKVSA